MAFHVLASRFGFSQSRCDQKARTSLLLVNWVSIHRKVGGHEFLFFADQEDAHFATIQPRPVDVVLAGLEEDASADIRSDKVDLRCPRGIRAILR